MVVMLERFNLPRREFLRHMIENFPKPSAEKANFARKIKILLAIVSCNCEKKV